MPGFFYGWGVSPDGSRLAVVGRNHQRQINVLTLADRTWREVSLEPGPDYLLQSLARAADGKSFFVTAWLPDSFNLLHVTPAGKVHPLVHNVRSQWLWGPLPSPDGKHLAARAQTRDSNPG